MASIYIAGPMSGIPEFNFPAFFAKEVQLKSEGWKVFNPASKEEEKAIAPEAFAKGEPGTGTPFKDLYLWDVQKVIEADAIYMLKGWERSPGACGEHAVAVALQRHDPKYQILYQ